MTHAHYPARYSAHVPPALAELIAAIRWTADPKSGRLGMTLAQEEVELLARHLLLPANENALDRSIAAVDQFMDSDDSHVLMPEHGEAILLILHELKRLRALNSQSSYRGPC
ncbi:MAG: hypothetical protein U5M50_10540 [Sphingobium sp.]|nr:hypothetical protein [Sphingobium sp.]